MVVHTRRSKAVDTNEPDQTVHHVDVAVTSQSDVELAKHFREKFLTRRKDPVGLVGRCVGWCQECGVEYANYLYFKKMQGDSQDFCAD